MNLQYELWGFADTHSYQSCPTNSKVKTKWNWFSKSDFSNNKKTRAFRSLTLGWVNPNPTKPGPKSVHSGQRFPETTFLIGTQQVVFLEKLFKFKWWLNNSASSNYICVSNFFQNYVSAMISSFPWPRVPSGKTLNPTLPPDPSATAKTAFMTASCRPCMVSHSICCFWSCMPATYSHQHT